jgi:hypothetical protein
MNTTVNNHKLMCDSVSTVTINTTIHTAVNTNKAQVYSHGEAGEEAALLESVSLSGAAKLDPAGFVESLQSARTLARCRKRLPQEQVPHVDLMAAWMGQVSCATAKSVTVKNVLPKV